jgi:predicted regulator of Ras-like GTPase activity (Roadblock/LC7/MglB family)
MKLLKQVRDALPKSKKTVPTQNPKGAAAIPASGHSNKTVQEGKYTMSTDISPAQDIAGFVGACLCDSDTGLMLGSEGGGGIDLEVAAAGNTEVVRAKRAVAKALGLNDTIEDILITLGKQYHLIRPLEKNPAIFLYVVLDKKVANLGMARVQVKSLESKLAI